MRVSVITPFYYGNDYIREYEKMMSANEEALSDDDELEVLIVNDSPEEPVRLRGMYLCRQNWRIITNEANKGIHASRLRGLSEATGEYVIFLDQDDTLVPDAIASFLEQAKAEVTGAKHLCYRLLVANAALEQEDGAFLPWYRTKWHKKQIDRLSVYTAIGTQIISPGQCMMAKCIIPKEWKDNVLAANGADDYYLWLLLLMRGIGVTYIDRVLYKHRYTSRNLSTDTAITDASTMQFVGYLEHTDFPRRQLALLKRQTVYKADFRRSGAALKMLLSLQNLDLFLANVWFKIKTRTGYGFNR